MPDPPDCPCQETMSKAQQIQCSKCDTWWHTACAGLGGLTANAVGKINQWNCHVCYELPEKIKNKSPVSNNSLKEIQQQMEISLKAFISKTIQDELNKKLTEEIDKRVKASLDELLSTESVEKKIEEKLKNAQLAKVTQEIEEKVNQKIKEIPSNSAESDENKIKIDQVIQDQKAEKVRQDEERLRKKKENNLMFYNIPEEEFDDGHIIDRMMDDFEKIKEAYAEKHITINEKDLVQINRVGAKRPDHIRPVVTTFASNEKRMEILTNSRNLKLKTEGHEIINIYVSTDKTPRQRAADKELREELKRRKAGGDTNLVIRNEKIVPFPGGAQQSWASKFRRSD